MEPEFLTVEKVLWDSETDPRPQPG